MNSHKNQITGCKQLIVVALREEFDVLKEKFARTLSSSDNFKHHILFSTSVRGDGQADFAVLLLEEMGIEVAYGATYTVARELKPEIIVNFGVSGALSDEIEFGDVVIAKSTENWSYDAKIVDKRQLNGSNTLSLKLSGIEYQTNTSIVKRLQSFKDNELAYLEWKAATIRQLDDLGIESKLFAKQNWMHAKVHIGYPVASGFGVVASEELKLAIKEHKRKHLCVDMESAGVARAAHELEVSKLVIVRAISDASNPNKSHLEKLTGGRIREWAIQNAIIFLNRTLWRTDEDNEELQNKLVELASKEFLPSRFDSRDAINSIDSNVVNDLYSISIENTTNMRPMDSAVSIVLASKDEFPLRVYGAQGTGKSSFLAILFWKILEEFEKEGKGRRVGYINLNRYTRGEHNIRTDRITNETPLQALQRHLKIFDHVVIGQKSSLLLIVDGFDPNGPVDKEIESYLLSTLDRFEGLQKVEGTRGTGSPSGKWGSPTNQFKMQSVPIMNEYCYAYSEAFSQLAQFGRSGEELLHDAAEYGLDHVDAFTLFILNAAIKIEDQNNGFSLLIDEFVSSWVSKAGRNASQHEETINRASRLAFSAEVGANIYALRSEVDQVAWGLVCQHSQVSSFLSARYSILEFSRLCKVRGKRKFESLPYVFPYRINKHCKYFLLQSEELEDDIFRVIKEVLNPEKGVKFHPHTKAHAAYLGGRLQKQQSRDQMIQILNRFLCSLTKPEFCQPMNDSVRVQLLVWRTVYISLAYLRDPKAESQYICQLLGYAEWDYFNRGFHLEYYGDQIYSPKLPLVSRDELADCSRTFDELCERLRSNRSLIPGIDLQTLLSLAQHRHEIGRLDNETRVKVKNLAKDMLKADEVNEILKPYVKLIVNHLELPEFHPYLIIQEAYKIKSLPRAGWLKRGLESAETVASHMYGAYLLGLFILPESVFEGMTYNKSRILQMLLIHDLGESRIGDYLPSVKTEAVERDERQYFEEIGLAGTYTALADLRKIASLYREFEEGVTTEALIARDLDRIDNLVQIWSYRNSGQTIYDYREWELDLEGGIRTMIGRRIIKSFPKKGWHEFS